MISPLMRGLKFRLTNVRLEGLEVVMRHCHDGMWSFEFHVMDHFGLAEADSALPFAFGLVLWEVVGEGGPLRRIVWVIMRK